MSLGPRPVPWAAVMFLLVSTGVVGLLPGVPISPAPQGTWATPTSGASPHAGLPGILSHSSPSPQPADGPVCAALQVRYPGLYDGPSGPVPLDPSVSTSCPMGSDRTGLGFLSNNSGSGGRFKVGIDLPALSSAAARTLRAFGIGLWVNGIPCSVGGVSYLTVELVPPYSGGASGSLANWSLWAPIWDLVPAGACDPQCQNSTALFSMPGSPRRYCEENAAIAGRGASRGSFGSLAPGDHLDLTFLPDPGGLSVLLNDSTNPSDDLGWSYGPTDVASGRPIVPSMNRSALSDTFWGTGPTVSASADLCPVAMGGSGGPPGPCNSYDGPGTWADAAPSISSIASWNSSASAYSNPYPQVSVYSSSGGCSGGLGTIPCTYFAEHGGLGIYPQWGIGSSGGSSTFTLGGSNGSAGADGRGWIGPYSASGGLGGIGAPVVVALRSNSTLTSGITVHVRVSDPNGIGSVRLSTYFCSASATPTVRSAAASEDPGTSNGSEDGNFTASVGFTASERGTVHYWVSTTSASGASPAPVRGSSTVGSGSSLCAYSPPPRPWFGVQNNLTVIAGGFSISYADNGSAVTNYTLSVVPNLGGPTRLFQLGPAGLAVVRLDLSSGTVFDLSLTAYDAAGLLSAPSGFTAGTLSGLSISLAATPAGPFWVTSDTVGFNVSVSGGLAPYTIHLEFADGTNLTTTPPGSSWNVSHPYGAYSGVAWVRASVLDSTGVLSAAPALPILILSGPLGINQTMSSGDFDVRLDWTAPSAPASPVTGYTVFYTNESAEGPFITAIGSVNDSTTGRFVWNTTATTLDITYQGTGVTVYAVVIARSATGVGTLPDGWFQIPSATTANLSASPILVSPVGGPAPLTVSLSDTVTAGTNATLVQSIYSFGGGSSVPANVTGNLTGRSAIYWLNASYTFPNSGPQFVVLHITDAYSDTIIPVVEVYVGPAPAPSVSAEVTSGISWVNAPVTFQATASGGSGSYAFTWNFGDGGNGTGAAPAHTYTGPGNYSVVVQVTDLGDGVVIDASVNLTVFAPPRVEIRTTALDGTGESYNFTALPTGGLGSLVYSWTFGDGTIGVGATVDHTYTSPGTYTVNLTVTDSVRRSAGAQVVVVVPAPPSTPPPPSNALTGPVLAAFAILGAIAVIFLIGMVYYWSKWKQPILVEPANRVSARPPPDPPDPS